MGHDERPAYKRILGYDNPEMMMVCDHHGM